MPEHLITSILLFFFTFMMLTLSWFGWRCSRNLVAAPIVADLIFYFVFIKILFYYVMPTFFRMVSNYKFVRQDGVSLLDLSYLYMIELISWTVWVAVILSVFKLFDRGRKRINIKQLIAHNLLQSKILFLVVCCGFSLTRILVILGFEINFLLHLFISLFFYTGLALGPFIFVLSRKYFGFFFLFLGLLTTVIALFSLSSRGSLVYTALFVIFLVSFVTKDYFSKTIVVIFGVITIGIYFTFGGLLFGQFEIDQIGNVVINLDINSHKSGKRSPLEEIEWRYGASTRMGTAFINMYDRGDSAGINPIKHSLMGFLPRSISPEKPHPSTLRGDDIFSQGMYLIYREIHGHNTYSMVEFPTGAHFYWEFGFIGVVVLSALSGLYIALCAHFFSKLGIIALPLMVAIFKPWGYMDPKIWVSDIALQIYQILIPLVALVLFIKGILFLKHVLCHSTASGSK